MTLKQPSGCWLYYMCLLCYIIYTHYIYIYIYLLYYVYTYIYLIPCIQQQTEVIPNSLLNWGTTKKSRSILSHTAIVLLALITCFSFRSQKIYFLVITLHKELPSSLSKANVIPSSRHKNLKENFSDILIILLCK